MDKLSNARPKSLRAAPFSHRGRIDQAATSAAGIVIVVGFDELPHTDIQSLAPKG